MSIIPDAGARPAERLAAGLRRLQLDLDRDRQARLLAYLELLGRWNRVYNLVARAPPLVWVARHLLDSLAVLPYLTGASCADLGTGAGLPGIPLAIAAPTRRWYLVDSNAKKQRFVREAIRVLALDGVSAIHCRIEEWHPAERPDAAIARALAAPLKVLAAARRLLAAGVPLYLMLGPAGRPALHDLPAGYRLRHLHPLEVPYLDGRRYLAIIENEVK